MSWTTKDNTYNDIREKSLMQWLDEIEKYDDIVVRTGTRLARDYINYLKDENIKLMEEIELRNEYMKKIKRK